MSKRLVIITAIVLLEAICLIGGVLGAGYGMKRSLIRAASQRAIDENKLFASQFASLVDEIGLRTVSPKSADWRRLQSSVERFKLPNGGFLCVTDSRTGQLLCHPDLRVHPDLRKLKSGLAIMETDSETGPITELVSKLKTAVGRVSFEDDVHIIAAQRLTDIDANVMVHQRLSAIEEAANASVAPIFSIGRKAIAAILSLSILGTIFLLRYYDTLLEKTNLDLEKTVAQQTNSLTRTRNAIIFGLAKLAENRDTDTGEHLDRIREYSTVLAKKLQKGGRDISDQFIEDIGLASALHDIGKVGIPDAVLLKPGKLDARERKIIEQHPIIGCKCLISIEKRLGDDRFLEMATEICLTHHEKWDGSGYPLRLKGAKIPISSRIVAVADVYDALTSQRPYKDRMPHEEAHAIIMRGSGTHFDPEIVTAFDSLYDQFKSIREKYLDEGDRVTIDNVLEVAGGQDSVPAEALTGLFNS